MKFHSTSLQSPFGSPGAAFAAAAELPEAFRSFQVPRGSRGSRGRSQQGFRPTKGGVFGDLSGSYGDVFVFFAMMAVRF